MRAGELGIPGPAANGASEGINGTKRQFGQRSYTAVAAAWFRSSAQKKGALINSGETPVLLSASPRPHVKAHCLEQLLELRFLAQIIPGRIGAQATPVSIHQKL
jgi:hypothetical protein